MNKVLLVGNLGADVVVTESKGVSYCRFSLATNERFRDREGVLQERADWHQVVAFSKLAQALGRLAKGERIAVEGKLRCRSYEKDGEKRWTVEVHAERVEFLGGKRRERDDASEPEESASDLDDEIPF
jgi:single-strand DNA-binding protein